MVRSWLAYQQSSKAPCLLSRYIFPAFLDDIPVQMAKLGEAHVNVSANPAEKVVAKLLANPANPKN